MNEKNDQIKKLQKKIKNLQEEMKNYDQIKTTMMIEKESERAKWNIEKEILNNQHNDLLEKFYKMQRKNEMLLVQNEKLKSENKSRRILNKSQTLHKNRSFIFNKFNNFKERSFIIDDSKSTITNTDKENSNKKNFKSYKNF